MPGSHTQFTEQPSRATVSSTAAVSGRRDSAPGRAISATLRNTTTVSSTNTPSGQSSAGSVSTVSQPCARSASA